MAKDEKDILNEITSLLFTLISIPSPTGKEMTILSWLSRYIKGMGLNIMWQKVDGERSNLLAWRGCPSLLIATHIDTVPAWGHPHAFSPKIERNKIYGRGAIDTKGQISALLLAIKMTQTPCAIALFVDEELEAKGSELFYIPKEMDIKEAIVLEPTGLNLAATEAGSIEVFLRIEGKSAHGAVPCKGKNAIETFCEFYRDLKQLPFLQYTHPLFSNVDVNIGRISGGIDCQLVAEGCEAEIDIPVLPGIDIDEAMDQITQLLGDYKIYFEVKSKDAPWEVLPHELAVKGLESCIDKVLKRRPSYIGMPAWTDASNLIKKGIPTIVFGAGDLALAHTKEEHADLDELLNLSLILKCLLECDYV